MYAKVLLCLALPVVANAMGVIVDVDRKACQDSFSFPTVAKFGAFATKEDCIADCQSESAAYPDDCRRSIVWQGDCGDDMTGICEELADTPNNCWCNYQTTCGCECYFCPVPDYLQDIDGLNGPYPVPDWDAIPPCAGATC